LEITFDNGKTFVYPAEYLRVYSPSAEVRSHNGDWRIPPRRSNVAVYDVEQTGNYALRLLFDDLHDTGIYSYSLLYDLGENKLKYMREYVREARKRGISRRKRT